MIKVEDAISVARSMIGTPYSTLDCINFIKKIIRTAPGGDRNYTDAHVPALWASYYASGKYKHLTEIREHLTDPQPGMLAFKGQPLGRDHQPSHVGLVTGPRTVIHSSSAKGGVVETDLFNGQWTLLARHRYIDVGKGDDTDMDDVLYQAKVVTESGNLNLRSGPSVNDKRIGSLARDSIVDVIKEYTGWDYVRSGQQIGYASTEYLQKIDVPSPDPVPDPDARPSAETTTLMEDDGRCIILVGHWRVVVD